MPTRVNKLGEDKIEIQEMPGESSVLDLATAKQRLESLQREKNNFVNPEMWQKQTNATKKAIAPLEGDNDDGEGERTSQQWQKLLKKR